MRILRRAPFVVSLVGSTAMLLAINALLVSRAYGRLPSELVIGTGGDATMSRVILPIFVAGVALCCLVNGLLGRALWHKVRAASILLLMANTALSALALIATSLILARHL